MAARMSADSFAANGPVHILAEGQTWQQECQQTVLQQMVQFTYTLRAKHSSKNVSRQFCSKWSSSHTSCEPNMKTNFSEHICTKNVPVHIHSETNTAQRASEHTFLQNMAVLTHT